MEITDAVLELIGKTTPGAYSIYAIDGGRMIQILRSDAVLAHSAFSPAEYEAIVADDAGAIVHENDRPHVARALAKLLADGEDVDFTYRIRHRTKRYVWVHAFGKYIGERAGLPVVMVAFHSTSGEADDHARLLANTATAVYVIGLEDHEILFANDAALRLWKLSEYGEGPCFAAIYGRKAVCPWCMAAKMKNGLFRQTDFYDERFDRWLDIRCLAMDWHGRPAAAIYAHDVSDEIRRRQTLELRKKDMEFVVDNIPIGVGVCTLAEGKIVPVAVNRKMSELLGTSSELFAHSDRDMLENVHPEDRDTVMKTMAGSALPGSEARTDYRYRSPVTGDWRWYRLIVRAIEYAAGSMAFVCLLDVTAEKAAALETIKLRSMYQTATTASGLVVWEYEPSAQIIRMQLNSDYTQRICEEYGIPQLVENGPRTLSNIVAEDDREAFLRMYRQIDAGAPRAFCEVGMTLGERLFYWKIICSTVYDDGGKPLAVYCTGQDVTAKYEEQSRFRNAFEQFLSDSPGSIGSFHHNLTKNLTDQGRGNFSEKFGEAARGSFDRHIAALLSTMERAEDRQAFSALFSREKLLEDFSQGRTHVQFDYLLLLNGRRRWIRCAVNMLRNPSTGDVEAASLATDITEQKKREAMEKRITEDEFDYIGVLSLSTGLFELYVKGPDVRYPALREPVPYESCVKYVGDNYVSRAEHRHFMTACSLKSVRASLKKRGSYESSYLREQDGIVTRRQLRYRWLDEAAEEVLVTRSDVTAAYEQEQRQLKTVREALAQAEKANAAKSEFLSRMSHDMRTPLNGIIGMTYLTEKLDLPDEVRENLSKIDSSSRFLLGLINDVLDMTKAESGKIELRPEPYSIEEFEQYINAVIRPLCESKGQRLVTAYEMPEGCAPLVDKLRMNQIVFNLLSNAVKYSPEGSEILYSDHSRLLPDGRLRDRIEVSDRGVGMSEDFQKVLFEPFTQENRVDNSEIRGSGLGLAITKKLVDAMGGTISVSSRIGEGTTIALVLDFDRAAVFPAAPDRSASDAGRGGAALAGRHILLCEDHPLNQEIATAILTEKGMLVSVADDGAAGVKLFENSTVGYFDCVLMDIRMPAMNGYEATKAIRALDRPDAGRVPIIAMTADAFESDVRKCLDAGMNAHIAKPIEADALYRALRQAIARA